MDGRVNVLAFDTCFSACSVAARAEPPGEAARVCAQFMAMDSGHAEALMPMIERAMREAGLAFADLDRIVVTPGPGTFTGVRTGVAAARALALATGAEIVAVSSLWLIAVKCLGQIQGDDVIVVAVDARKGQFYVQAVDRLGQELTPPLLVDPADVAALCPGRRLTVIGNGAAALAAAVHAAGRQLLMYTGSAESAVAELPDAFHLLQTAGRSSITAPLLPLYLRPPDAKPQAGKALPWSPT